MIATIQEYFEKQRSEISDLYQFLNSFRSWFNDNVSNYEIFLEDEWFSDKTTIEYTIRCLDTFNIRVIAVDEYQNHRDNKGVWHLGEYIRTCWCVEDPWMALESFFAGNTEPRPHDSEQHTE